MIKELNQFSSLFYISRTLIKLNQALPPNSTEPPLNNHDVNIGGGGFPFSLNSMVTAIVLPQEDETRFLKESIWCLFGFNKNNVGREAGSFHIREEQIERANTCCAPTHPSCKLADSCPLAFGKKTGKTRKTGCPSSLEEGR